MKASFFTAFLYIIFSTLCTAQVTWQTQNSGTNSSLNGVDFDGTRNESKVVNVEINHQPNDYSLEQNYPNPFNPSTTIQYSIPKGENVVLKIYNSLGQEVKTLVNGYIEAGEYKVNFNARNLDSGVYYYKLSSGNFNSVKKMILIK